MANIGFYKILNTLPLEIEKDSFYLVSDADRFDLYVTSNAVTPEAIRLANVKHLQTDVAPDPNDYYEGDEWLNVLTLTKYKLYYDGTKKIWVEIGNNLTADPVEVEEAPIDGNQYARKDAGWVTVESGGHVILDPAGNTMPTQPALQFGAGFTVTDETGKTVVGRVITYTIDFGTTSIIAQEINMFGAAVIDNIIASNIASILLTYSGGLQQVITPGINTIAITAGDILTWEITRTNVGQLAALGIHLSLNE